MHRCDQPRRGFLFDELHLRGVPELYARYARTPGIRQVVMSKHRSWKVDLNKLRASNKSYLESLSANTRYQIRRAARLYGARGQITAKRADNFEEALTFYEAMKEISTAYWSRRGKTGSFAYPFFDHFHRRLISNCMAAGTVEIIRLTSGDQVIGYLYNFIYKSWVYAYQCAFVFESDSKYKPGLLAHSLCIEQHLRLGDAVYDFLPGYSRYKSNLGTQGVEMLDIVLQRPTATLTVEHYLRQVKHAIGNRLMKTCTR
jgi:CelD/BcsL family acetyltransferase involved in cellulose biosynthesis